MSSTSKYTFLTNIFLQDCLNLEKGKHRVVQKIFECLIVFWDQEEYTKNQKLPLCDQIVDIIF